MSDLSQTDYPDTMSGGALDDQANDDQANYFSPDDSTVFAAPGDELPGSAEANNQVLKDALTSLGEATASLRVTTEPDGIRDMVMTALWRANVVVKGPNEFDDRVEPVYTGWRDFPTGNASADKWIHARDIVVSALDTFDGAARNSVANDSKDLVMRAFNLDLELQKLVNEAQHACQTLTTSD